jgi:hypothetical protein
MQSKSKEWRFDQLKDKWCLAIEQIEGLETIARQARSAAAGEGKSREK